MSTPLAVCILKIEQLATMLAFEEFHD